MNRLPRLCLTRSLTLSATRLAAFQDPFKVLGVNRRASKKEIHDAYLRKCMKCHPDIYGDDPEKLKEFREVQDAFDRVTNWAKEKPHFDSSTAHEQRKNKQYHSNDPKQQRPEFGNWYSKGNSTDAGWNPKKLRFGDDIIERQSRGVEYKMVRMGQINKSRRPDMPGDRTTHYSGANDPGIDPMATYREGEFKNKESIIQKIKNMFS